MCRVGASEKKPAPPTQNFWPSLNLKEQSNLVRGNKLRTSYDGNNYLIFGIHLNRIMKACWDKAPCQLRIWETRELRSPGTAIRNKGRTYLRQGMPGCPITPIRCRSSLRWWDVGNTYATVSESEVICDFRCGLKAKGNAPVGFRFEGVRNTPIWSPTSSKKPLKSTA